MLMLRCSGHYDFKTDEGTKNSDLLWKLKNKTKKINQTKFKSQALYVSTRKTAKILATVHILCERIDRCSAEKDQNVLHWLTEYRD